MFRVQSIIYLSVCALLLAAGDSRAADVPDFARIDRHIVKQPVYKSKQPLYGVYVLGPEARTRVWAVFDTSGTNGGRYDVLYFDRHADGDLTVPEDRIEGRMGSNGVTFAIGSFTDPLTKQKHTDLSITRLEGTSPSVMLQMKWCGKVVITGGYAAKAGPYTRFATAPAEAPILWPGADGRLSFQLWDLKPLAIGGADDVQVFLGHGGRGPNTFCAVPDTFLPKEIPVPATLIYTDKVGRKRRLQSRLRERC